MHILSGLDVFLKEHIKEYKNMNIGLITNHTSVTKDFQYSFDIFSFNNQINLVRIFTPEHGLFGVEEDMIPVQSIHDTTIDTPIISLYGSTEEYLKPSKEDLKDIDCLFFDIQDIGSRYYTYIYTMSYCMEAAKELDIPFVILDRPNPLNGITIEGPSIKTGFESFVGRYPICVRHGMTAGELGLMFNEQFNINCKLKIIKIENWDRKKFLWLQKYNWILPSPNMPTYDTALVYPGGCLFEGTNLSEGRGTTMPFLFVGAPYINHKELSNYLNSIKLKGVMFRYNVFRPKYQKHAGKLCYGISINITDQNNYSPFLTGIAIIKSCYDLFPDHFEWRKEAYEFVKDRLAFDLLCGSSDIRLMIENHSTLDEIQSTYKEDEETFKKLRRKYLLY